MKLFLVACALVAVAAALSLEDVPSLSVKNGGEFSEKQVLVRWDGWACFARTNVLALRA